MASAMNRLRQASLLSVVAAVLLSVTCAHPSLAADRRGSRPAQAGFSLRPPFNGTYRLTALFDHRYPNYALDGEITAYTGESVPNGSPHYYQGHSGVDWSMPVGTRILAAADGVVEVAYRTRNPDGADGPYGVIVVLRHSNNYRTLYAHLLTHTVQVGSFVSAGQVIGLSGNTGRSSGPHLHFGVYLGPCWDETRKRIYELNATDPFGWRGSYPDPLLAKPGGPRHTASCLWRSYDEDSVSCADTIVEDGGQGFSAAMEWRISDRGHGSHMHYHTITTTNKVTATWLATTTLGGAYKVYAFIPSRLATARQATYRILTANGWVQRTVNQQEHSDV